MKDFEWRHLHTNSSKDLAMDYYKDITKKQITSLYKSYEPDFLMFGYDIKEYLLNAKD